MAINRILGPSPLPLTTADYEAQNNLLVAGFSGQETVPWSASAMQIGAVFQVGGTIYRVDTATAITGTPSEYVKITPAGATASASFVANLTGVTWNTVYNGYYDGSGNRYLFDEVIAFLGGVVGSLKDRDGLTQAVVGYLRNASNLNAGTIPAARLSATDLLAKLITVDGSGSGLDSDLIRGSKIRTSIHTTDNTFIVPSIEVGEIILAWRVNTPTTGRGNVMPTGNSTVIEITSAINFNVNVPGGTNFTLSTAVLFIICRTS